MSNMVDVSKDVSALIDELIATRVQRDAWINYAFVGAVVPTLPNGVVKELPTKIEELTKALRSISSLWPEPPNCADIRECVGVNDGRARTIVAVYALKIAREALGITTAGLDWED